MRININIILMVNFVYGDGLHIPYIGKLKVVSPLFVSIHVWKYVQTDSPVLDKIEITSITTQNHKKAFSLVELILSKDFFSCSSKKKFLKR